MNEKDIRAAFEQIEPPDGAQERMYQNILKKSAMQQPAPKKAEKPVWQRYAALAACLILVCTAGFFAPRGEKSAPVQTEPANTEFSQPPMMSSSLFEDVSGPADFEALGFTIDAPNGASAVTYCIAYGDTAQVSFTLDGCEYRYEACAEEPFAEGVSDTPAMTDSGVVWETDGVQYRLSAYGSASADTILELAEQLSQN